jgi:ATP-dependent DNA ligase
MLLESGKLPEDDARHLYEMKYDGWRAIIYADRGELRVVTRRRHHQAAARGPQARARRIGVERRGVADGELLDRQWRWPCSLPVASKDWRG